MVYIYMLYKKIYIYVNVRIVTISLLCLTTGVVHQIFTQFREIDRLSLYISFFLSLSLTLLIYPFFSPISLFFSLISPLFSTRTWKNPPLLTPSGVGYVYIWLRGAERPMRLRETLTKFPSPGRFSKRRFFWVG